MCPTPPPPPPARPAWTRYTQELRRGLAEGRSAHPLFAAVVHTARRYRIDPGHFTDFLTAMRMDLTVTDYPTRAALNTYIRGSAEVIGLQVLPVLGTVTSQREAAPHAAALGNAFQLTNFIRDIAEDLDLGRIYLPADELAAFGVDRDRLLWCRRTRRVDQPVRRALADQVARARALYRFAEPGIAMLDPVARPCVATAFTLYGEILDHITRAGYNVFASRAAVPATRRLAVATPALVSTLAARSTARLSAGGKKPWRALPPGC